MRVRQKPSWIKLLGPSYSREEIDAVIRVLKSGWWGLGPVTGEFEKKFASFVGAKYAVAVNSASAGLHLAVKVLDKKGKKNPELIVPALTFFSTAGVGLYEGYKIVFADIDERTLCLDPKDVQRKTTSNTIGVIPVHYGGRLASMSYLKTLPIIEDSAHAAGNPGAGKKGLMSVWSFHAVKNIATGDMGMITTNDENIALRLKRLRWFGIDMSTYDREKKGYNWEYNIEEVGYKYHGNDIMSALGLAQLHRLHKMNQRRKAIAKRYERALAGLPITLPPWDADSSWHLYVIRVAKNLRNALIDTLRANKISPGVHYKPLYYYPVFSYSLRKAIRELPVTHKVWQEIISLPIFPDLTDQEQDRVIAVIKAFFARTS